MKAIYLNVLEKELPQIIDIKDNLNTYYKLLKCNTIDIVTRTIEGHSFSVVCDDEGLLKENPIISAVSQNSKVQFVGNLIFCGIPNDEGEMLSLTNEECKTILHNVCMLINEITKEKHFVISNVEF